MAGEAADDLGETNDPALYAGPIFDAHHHLWDTLTTRHPWLDTPENATLAATGSLDRYRAAAGTLKLVGSVWIEALAADPVAEIARVTAMTGGPDEAAGSKRARLLCTALVAHAALDSPDLDARLDRLTAATPRLRGIRDIVAVREGASGFARRPDLLTDAGFLRGCRTLARRGLAFDLMVEPRQSAEALALIDAVPDLAVALEHAGSPDFATPESVAVWRDAMATYAARPTVTVKISALHCRMPGWTDARLADAIRHLVDLFGPNRLAFASDWPAHDRTVPMERCYLTFRRAVSDLGPDEQRALFERTGRALYGV